MSGGWVKLHRQALDNEWLKNPVLWTFWCYCLLKATHAPTTAAVGYQRVPLEPGQFVFGREKAAAELRMSVRTVRTCLDALKSTSNLTIKTTSKFSVVTVVNWRTYQEIDGETGQQTGQQSDQQPASNRPATDHIQEGKEGKEKDIVPFAEILDHLNAKAGRKFKVSEAHKRHIRARWNEGHRFVDFKTVIDSKAVTWKADPKMAEYLRPETLFGSKFDGYLQAAAGSSNPENAGTSQEVFCPVTALDRERYEKVMAEYEL